MNKTGIMTNKDMDVCIKNIAGGDMNSLRELYEELRIPIYKFVLSITKSKDLTDDIVQETFLRVRANAQTYRLEGKPKAWIFSIARNLSVSELRQAVKTVDIDELDDMYYSNKDIIDINESPLLLDLLKPDEKEIVSLYVLADFKHLDIARMLNMPYEQVRWKYAYAIKKLKNHLTNLKKEEGFSIETKKN